MRAFRIIFETAKSYYEEMLFFFLTGAILLVFAIPAVLLLPSIFSLLLLLPIPFGIAGIWIVAHRAVRGLGVKWRLYWEAVKEYGPKSLLLTFIILAGYAIFLGNIWFYNNPDISPFSPKVASIITPVWIVLALVWTGIAFYAEGFLIELEEPKILTILRNGLSLTVLKPLATVILLIVTALLTALSIVMPILFIALPGFIGTLVITGVRTLIADIREKYGDKEEDEETTEEEVEDTDTIETDVE